MLVDTDVMIWYLRGRESAADFLSPILSIVLSVVTYMDVTYMELVKGMHTKQELRVLRQTLNSWNVPVLPIDEAVSYRAAFYVEQHFHNHALRLADALTAATAIERGLVLAVANSRHYRVVEELELKVFQP